MKKSLFSAEQVRAMERRALVDLYNALTGKSISRFSSAEAGVKQVLKQLSDAGRLVVEERPAAPAPAPRDQFTSAVQQIAAMTEPEKLPACPGCASTDTVRAGRKGTLAHDRLFCNNCQREFWRDGKEFQRSKPGRDAGPGARTASRSLADAWKDPAIAAARSVKQRVFAEGKEYRSVRAAFAALGLPDAAHIAFRMKLKAAGTAEFEKKTFSIVAKEPPAPKTKKPAGKPAPKFYS